MKEPNRILSRFFLGSLVLLLAGLLAACGTARRTEPISGPLNTTSEQIARGEHVFMANCQRCHPGGEAGAGPSINNVPLTRGMIKFRVRSKAFLLGLGRMPSFKEHEISDEELKDLVAYIKAMKRNKPADANVADRQ